MTEADVVNQVKEIIRITGVKIQRINTGCFRVGNRWIKTAEKGTLDFEGYDKHGRFVGIECKRPQGGKLSPEQRARINDINKKGGLAIVVTSGDDALNFLLKHDCI